MEDEQTELSNLPEAVEIDETEFKDDNDTEEEELEDTSEEKEEDDDEAEEIPEVKDEDVIPEPFKDEEVDQPDTDEEPDNQEPFIEPKTEYDPELSLDNVTNEEGVPADRKIDVRIHSREIIREFSKTEIQEINQYLTVNVPYSALTQLFTLTDKPYDKAKVFTGIFRLITSAMHYVSAEETRKKMEKLLKDCVPINDNIYVVLTRYDNSAVQFNRHRLLRKMENVFLDQKTNQAVNKLIDAFLVFAEKQELMDIDRIAGLDLETDEGKKAYKSISTGEEVSQE